MKSEYNLDPKLILIGVQMLFVAFGALILLPIITGLDSNVALFTAGIGTLAFQIITKGKVPIFLASSFAFAAPIMYGVQEWGIPATMSGLMASGFFYMIVSYIVKIKGVNFVHKLFPPIVTGPIIILIGLILAPVAVNMAVGKTGDGSAILYNHHISLLISGASLVTIILVSIFAKGFCKLISILLGLIVGYTLAILFGIVDFGVMHEAKWFAIPKFVMPEFNLSAIIFILPVCIAPMIEHFGDILAIGAITKKDYLKDPGIHKTIFGDGFATALAALFGGPPNTTYSEVTGAVALTKAVNPAIMTFAAIFAILLSFVGKVGILLHTIPTPVMGGIMILLFGTIVVIGLETLNKEKINYSHPRNIVIIGIMLVFGIGGMFFRIEEFEFGGIGLAGLLGIILNLILPKE